MHKLSLPTDQKQNFNPNNKIYNSSFTTDPKEEYEIPQLLVSDATLFFIYIFLTSMRIALRNSKCYKCVELFTPLKC